MDGYQSFDKPMATTHSVRPTFFCVDYQKLNNITQKCAYPLQKIDATLDTLHGSQWFSTQDLWSGYWQEEVAEMDRPKTAFCTTKGLYQFCVTPFGLCNAPTTFQWLMDPVLAELQWKECLVTSMMSLCWAKTSLNISTTSNQSSRNSVNPSKCSFYKSEVQYLDHIIPRCRIATDPKNTERVSPWPRPICKREVQ